MTMGDGIRTRAIKGGGKKKPSQIVLSLTHQKIKSSLPQKENKMSEGHESIPLSNEEDAQITLHTVVIEAAKEAKGECQRHQEGKRHQRVEEVE